MRDHPGDTDYIIDIRSLTAEYRTFDSVVQAVNNLDLRIERGKRLGLVGETGAGKTTTGLLIMRLLQEPQGVVVNGSVFFNGQNLLEFSEKEMEQIRGKEIAMIFQDPMTSLNPVLCVEEQIAEVVARHEKIGNERSLQKARDLLEMVGIPRERGKEYPHQFSGGMKQRVVIAIALACSPKLLIADEPTTALDVTIQAQVLELIRTLRERDRTSMLMITHDLGIVAEVCDEVSVIYAGHIIEHGLLEDIFDHRLHPYTQGLFDSLPNIKNRRARLKPISGLMPDPTDLPKGCAFHPRCKYVTPVCETHTPARVYRNEEHYVECHLYNQEEAIRESKVKSDG